MNINKLGYAGGGGGGGGGGANAPPPLPHRADAYGVSHVSDLAARQTPTQPIH